VNNNAYIVQCIWQYMPYIFDTIKYISIYFFCLWDYLLFVVLCVIYAGSDAKRLYYSKVEHCINMCIIWEWESPPGQITVMIILGGNVWNYHKINVTINASNEIPVEM